MHTDTTHSAAESTCPSPSGTASDAASDAHSEDSIGADWALLSDSATAQHLSWYMGDAVLDYHNVSGLLSFYGHNYHVHLPILDRVTSVTEFHDSNVFLFWTVLRVASYRHPKFSHVFQLSSQSYEQLFMTHLLSPIRDFRTVQAILIFCHWPNSGSRQSQDPSWQYCGIAMNAALQMGLDQPQPETIYPGIGGKSNVHQMSVYSRRMTWLSCFNTSTSLSVWFGIRPHLSSPSQLNMTSSMAKEPTVPRYFMVQVEIQRQVVQYSTALSGEVDSSTCSTLQNLFINELDALLTAHRDIWSPRLEIQYLGAKLYLFSLCLTLASKRRSRPQDLDRSYAMNLARVSIQLGLPSAVSLIHTLSQLNRESLALGHQQRGVIHYPKFYFRLVVFAVVFLIKFLSANPTAAQEDRELAFSHIATAHQFFSSFAPARDFVRVAEVMADMARNLRLDSPQDNPNTVETRMGASLLYDTMGRLRGFSKESGENEGAATTAAYTNAGMRARSDDAGTVLHNSAEMGSSFGHSPGTISNNWPDPQPNLGDGLDCFRWMSDDMLVEVLNL